MAANTPPGPGVDASGQAVLDPTKNVLQLVDAAIKRQDDLRKMDHKALRRESKLRAYYEERLREGEAERLDAIRANDQGQVQRAAEVSATTATTLAQTLAQTAEAMRTQVQAAATVTATALDAKIAPLQTAIGDLQRFQFEYAGGKSQVVEARDAAADNKPVLDAIAMLVAAQNQNAGGQAKTTDNRLWIGLAISAVVMGFMFLSLLISAGALAFALTR
jgi:hypothetical protein